MKEKETIKKLKEIDKLVYEILEKSNLCKRLDFLEFMCDSSRFIERAIRLAKIIKKNATK